MVQAVRLGLGAALAVAAGLVAPVGGVASSGAILAAVTASHRVTPSGDYLSPGGRRPVLGPLEPDSRSRLTYAVDLASPALQRGILPTGEQEPWALRKSWLI